MFDGIKRQIERAGATQSNQKNAAIRVVGDRASGKTTYMAALTRFPQSRTNTSKENRIVQSVSATNEDGKSLINKAQNILEQGLELEPTDLAPDASSSNDYQLSIALSNLSRLKSSAELTRLNVSFKDYAGEFFSDLLYDDNDPNLKTYLADCAQATGLMFLLDGSAQREDENYAAGVEKLLNALPNSNRSNPLKRIALVLTKCEMPDLWMKRKDPEHLAQLKFKRVYTKMRNWQSETGGDIGFFTSSAFGVLEPRFGEANSKTIKRDRGGIRAVIKDSNRWKPFGLVAPIYWLCTGDRNQKLDEE